MDAAWSGIAEAVLQPRVEGDLAGRLKKLIAVDDPAGPHGLSYFGAWYSYVVSQITESPPSSTAIWAALDTAGHELAAKQGPDPTAWRADATAERLSFGFLPLTARWTNRPTFQQVITFTGHRPR